MHALKSRTRCCATERRARRIPLADDPSAQLAPLLLFLLLRLHEGRAQHAEVTHVRLHACVEDVQCGVDARRVVASAGGAHCLICSWSGGEKRAHVRFDRAGPRVGVLWVCGDAYGGGP